AESPTTPTSRASFAPRSARPRLRHRSVDAAPGGESDRALNRRALSPGHVWKILRALDWSLQRPAKQARERKPEKVRRWLTQTWPEIKKRLAAARPGSSSKTRAASRNVPPSAGPGLPKAKPRS